MGSHTIATKLDQPYEGAVPAVRAALAEQSFGIQTEIADSQALLTETAADRLRITSTLASLDASEGVH